MAEVWIYVCVNNGKLLRFLSDRLCVEVLHICYCLHLWESNEWHNFQMYIFVFFSVQIIQLPASPFVWFPVFLTHGFTPSWMLGDMDLKPTWYAHTSLNRNSNRTILSYFGAWIPKIMVWKKDFPFSTIGICLVSSSFSREYVFVCDICGTRFWTTSIVTILVKKSGHPLQSPVPRLVSLASWGQQIRTTSLGVWCDVAPRRVYRRLS